MAAQFGVSSALLNGISIPEGSEIDQISETLSVEIVETTEASSGDIILADPANAANKEVQISGDGPFGLSLTPGDVAVPGTVTVTRVEVSEAPNRRCTFSIRAAGAVAFTDPGTEIESDPGAEPTIADLTITSVEYSIAESVRRSYELQDAMVVGSDGKPALRQTHGLKGSFSIAGRGEAPVGVAAGTGGAEFAGSASGKVVVATFAQNERRGDWEGWSADGSHYPDVVLSSGED